MRDVPDSAARLASAVRERRIALAITQAEAASVAGVSAMTWHTIETGKAGALRDRTLAGIDKALQWRPGSAQMVLDGAAPEEDPAAPQSSDLRAIHARLDEIAAAIDDLRRQNS